MAVAQYIEHMPGMYVYHQYWEEELSHLDNRTELRHYEYFSTSGYDPHVYVVWAPLNRRIDQLEGDYI